MTTVGMEIYTDNNVLQIGKEYYAAFLSEPRTAAQVNSGNVGNWQGVFKILQTSGARIEKMREFSNSSVFPELTNYTPDTKWFRLLWREMTGGLAPTNVGIEIYDGSGNIEYNSNYNPLKVLDIVSGSYSKPLGSEGTRSGLYEIFKKKYSKPIMVMIDRAYYVNDGLKIIADKQGRFELYLDYDNTGSWGSTKVNYHFIVLDATSAL